MSLVPDPAAAAVAATLVLCDAAAPLRYRVLTELLDVSPDDPEAADLGVRRHRGPEVAALVGARPEGLRDESWLLCRWAQLGFDRSVTPVRDLAERVLARQLDDGSFPVRAFRPDDRYTRVPLQVSLPLRGLAWVGYATDERAARAYEWLLGQRLDDGTWGAGWAAGQPARVPAYRRLHGSPGCRANTQSALECLTLHPERRRDPAVAGALRTVLRRATREEWTMGSEVARLAGVERPTGFFTLYARRDVVHTLAVATRVDGTADDPYVHDLVALLLERQGPAGLWEHPTHPELSRWLTFDILLSLRRLTHGPGPRAPGSPGGR